MSQITKEEKTKWIEDLRSGKYEQTRGILKDCNGYCCLGILSHISAPEKYGEANDQIYDYFDSALKASDDMYSADRVSFTRMYLTDMNDEGIPFAGIADWIENNVVAV